MSDLRSTLVAARLCRRLLRPRRPAEWAGAAGVAVCALLATAAAATTLGVLGALGARNDVSWARAPLMSQSERASLVDQESYDIGGKSAVVTRLGPRNGTPLPPGAERWPTPGQVLLSPAARASCATNPYLRALVAGRDSGTIGPAGLRDPDEIVAYVGADAATVRAYGGLRASGFGAPSQASEDLTGRQRLMTAAITLGVVGGTVIAVLTAAGSLSSAACRRRLAVLQLLGAPRHIPAAVAAVQAGLFAALGVTAGLAIAAPVAGMLATTGMVGARWWASAGWPGRLPLAVLGLGVVAFVASRAARDVDADPWRVRRRADDRPVSLARLAPLILGVLLLCGVILGQRAHSGSGQATPPSALLLLATALLSLGVGLPLASPVLVRASTRLIRGAGLSWRLGGARAGHHARSGSRLTSVIVLLLLAAGVAAGARGGIADPSTFNPSTRSVRVDGRDSFGRPAPIEAVRAGLRASAAVGARVVCLTARGHRRPADRVGEIRPDDDCEVSASQAGATEIAAAVQAAWPAAPPLIDGADLDAHQNSLVVMGSILLALGLAVGLSAVATGITLVAAQADRRGPDGALLASGLSRGGLARARAAEVAVSTLPSVTLAGLAAVALGEAVKHVDDTALAPRLGSFASLPALGAALIALMAGLAALTTPGDATIGRRGD